MPIINSQSFKRMHGIPQSTPLSINEISRLSGFPKEALQEVYNRGIGAWKTNIQSVRTVGTYKKDEKKPRSQKLPAEQWGYGRLYAFVMKGKGTFYGADKDIAEKYGLL